jgi:protein involved in polysaccharide export with SLBB domain
MKPEILLCLALVLIGCAGDKPANPNSHTAVVSPNHQTIQVSMSGWVRDPGDYSLHTHATLVEALEAAGGFRDFGHSNFLKIVRTRNGQERAFSVRLQYVGGKPQSDFELEDGDKISAQEALL